MCSRVCHAFFQHRDINNADLNSVRWIMVHNDILRLRNVIMVISVELVIGYNL